MIDVTEAFIDFRESYNIFKAIKSTNEQGLQLIQYNENEPYSLKLYIHNNNDYAEQLSNTQKNPIRPNYSLNSTNLAYINENYEIFWSKQRDYIITLEIDDIISYDNKFIIINMISDKKNIGNYIRYTGRLNEEVNFVQS